MTLDRKDSGLAARLGRSRRTLNSVLDGTMGSAGEFTRNFLIPHAFVFVLLLVVGAILVQGIESFVVRLAALAFLLGIGAFVSTAREYVSYRFALTTSGFLGVSLTGAAILGGLEPMTHLFLPLGGLLLPFVFVRLPLAVVSVVSGAAVVLIIFYTPFGLRDWGIESGVLGGVSGILFISGLVLVRARSMKPEGIRYETPLGAEERPIYPAIADDGGSLVDERMVRRDLQLLLNRTALSEFLGEVFWRLISVSVLIGGIVCFLVIQFEPIRPLLALSWVALAAIELTIFIQILQAREMDRVMRGAFLCAVVVIGWWEIIIAEPRIDGVLPEIMLGFIVITLGSAPWSRRLSFSLVGIFIGAAVLRFISSPEPLLFGIGLAALCPFIIRLSALNFVHLSARVALHFLRRFGEGSPTSLAACRALGWQLSRIIESQRVLILVGERRLEVLEAGVPRPSPVDPIFTRGLYHVVSSHGGEEGILPFRDLSPQFLAPCIDWFGFAPAEFFFLRVTAILDGREETIVIVLPCTVTARLCGNSRILRILGGLAAIVRGWLAAARGRFLSSDVIMASQQSISAREEDLNNLVHLVNNVAQDISAECDELRQARAAGDASSVPPQVEAIERLVRSLSAGVSDVKLLKELLRVRVLPAPDTVDVDSLIDDVGMFGAYRASRSGKPFRVEGAAQGEVRLSVGSREFLGMVLRMLIRLAESRAPQGEEILLKVSADESSVRLGVSDRGAPLESERLQREMVKLDEGMNADRTIDMYRAAYNLARLSRGEFLLVREDDRSEAVLRFPRAAELAGAAPVDGWILLVDDNPQVTNFYARVAEALHQRYFTAASVEEAQAIVSREGRPRLVVTDLQLGEGSGLDLLRDLRQRFDRELPIVVVSGNTGSGVADEVRTAGATSYLAKPVGRSRLLAEMQSLLHQ